MKYDPNKKLSKKAKKTILDMLWSMEPVERTDTPEAIRTDIL